MRRNYEEKEQDREKGHQFEIFVTSLFNKTKFNILNGPHHYNERNRRDLTEEDFATDLKIRHKETDIEFYIQCKYISEINEDLKWTTPKKLRKYRKFDRSSESEFFIIVGVGGIANNPERLFFGHISEFHHSNMWSSTYEDLERPPGEPFDLYLFPDMTYTIE